jgi:predicted glycoside hydrolase/deacetylase ChbG (UPF0249 family)
VNAHKHFHLHPAIADAIFDIGEGFGMRAMRVPYEPSDILTAAEGGKEPGFSLTAFVATLSARRLLRRARRQGLVVPDAVFGLRWSGAMTRERLGSLLRVLPAGLVEIYTHPATTDDFPGHAPGYRYAAELEALTDQAVADAVHRSAFRLGGFADAVVAAKV